MLRVGKFVFVACADDQGVEGEFARAENQDEQADEPEDEGVGGDEFIGRGEKGGEGLTVGGDVGSGHIDKDAQRGDARKQSEGEENAADELEAGDEGGGEPGRGKAEALEKLGHVREVVKFAPAVLGKLPAPVDADDEQEWRLQAVHDPQEYGVEAFDWIAEIAHQLFSLFKMSEFGR